MKFIITMSLSLLLSNIIFAQSQNSILGAWSGFSDPDIFSSNFTHELSALPLEGNMNTGTKAWSGDFWASKKGSINIRWNAPGKPGWDYKSPTKDEVAKMPLEELKKLSPTEKYDLFLGRYNYPLKAEVYGSASKSDPYWAGICHGWATASLFHSEPTPKTLTNPDAIQIPFGSGDIKALISYYYAFYHTTSVNQVGLRCYFGSWMGGARGCDEDLNAGAFHIVIANKLGLLEEGLGMDVDRFNEIWNQPIVGYKTTILDYNLRPSRTAARSAVTEIRVATELFYADEADPTWEVGYGTKNQLIVKKDLKYRLELNAQGKIVGGAWESKERPDFLWNKKPATKEEFKGQFKELPKLFND